MQGSSPKAFSKNVGAEMDSGKPQKQALAVAYAIRRRNKKAHGGEVDSVNEKLHPMHEPNAFEKEMYPEDTDMMVDAMRKKMCAGGMYADGGMAQNEEEDYSMSQDDMLSDDNHLGEPDAEVLDNEIGDPSEHTEEMDNPELIKKKRLGSIMASLRMKHYES